jgi:cytosine permease
MGKKKKHLMETTTLTEVPMEERKSWISVAFMQAGIMICVPSMLLGGMLAQAMSLRNAIFSGIVGYIIVIFVFSLMGIMGSDMGIPTCMTTLSAFGKKGSRYIISTLIYISMIGWFAVQNGVCGSAFSNLMRESFDINFPVSLSTGIWGVIMLVTAVYGINALDKLNKIAVPALFVITIVGTVMALNKYGTSNLNVMPEKITMSFIDGVVLTVSFMAAGCLAAADITRYQATRKDTILSSSIGVAPAGILMIILGAIMTKIAQQYDITIVFCEIGIPILGMLVLIAATWTTNTTNAYSGGINAVMMFNLEDEKRGMATMVSGLIGTICALLGFGAYFENFLYILGDLMLPTMGAILADYWIISKGKPENFKVTDGFNWIGIVSWLIGYAVIKLFPYGVPFAQGMITTAIVYVILAKTIKRPQDKAVKVQ